MSVHPELVGLGIIGQMGGFASGVFGVGLGAIRLPGGVPEGIGGLLFETQWLYWLMALVGAGAMVYLGRSRADARLRKIGMVAGVVTLVWMGMAYAMDTPRERLHRAHTELAEAAKNGDVDRILSFLTSDFQATVLGVNAPGAARDEIGARLKAYGVKGSTIRAYKSTIAGTAAFTQLNVLTQTDGGPVLTSWELSWDDVQGEDWKIRNANLVKVGDEQMGPGSVLPK